jgi:hypothetical protein
MRLHPGVETRLDPKNVGELGAGERTRHTTEDDLVRPSRSLVLAIVSLIACTIPARRATQIYPAITLQAE